MTSASSRKSSTPRSRGASKLPAAAPAPAKKPEKVSDEQRLIDLAAELRHDPYGWVMAAYPWGEPGTILEKHPGPDTWQADALQYIGEEIGKGRPLRIAIAGGVGPGKSALMAWVVNWGMTTCADTRIRLTANTGPQLSTQTWPEISKWTRLSLWESWWDLGDRRFRSIDGKHRDSWRCDAITWDEKNPEAFAGFHNAGRRIIYGFDESAAIAPSIFKESEGILSGAGDTEIIWLCLGNPTRNTGDFRTFFPGGSKSHLWKHFKIDTRKARMADQAQIAEWIETYGLDHDFVRVRVLSEFPRAASTQFISEDLVKGAADPGRDMPVTIYDPLIVGVDVARFGDDKSVIRFRRGRDARTIKPLKFRNLDTMQLAARVAEVNEIHRPDAIFVDEGGLGAGVVDRCRQLQLPVIGVAFGAAPDRGNVGTDAGVFYYNKRAEMYGTLRSWLPGGMIDDDPELKADMTAVEYGYKLRDGHDAILLERKEDMKKRGLASPDDSDALALTFAYPVAPSDHSAKLSRRQQHQVDYDPLAYKR